MLFEDGFSEKAGGVPGRCWGDEVFAYRHEDLSFIPRTHIKKPGMMTRTWDPSVEKVEIGKALGEAGPATLAYLVSSKPVRDPAPNMIVYNAQGTKTKAVLWHVLPCGHLLTHECIWTHIH